MALRGPGLLSSIKARTLSPCPPSTTNTSGGCGEDLPLSVFPSDVFEKNIGLTAGGPPSALHPHTPPAGPPRPPPTPAPGPGGQKISVGRAPPERNTPPPHGTEFL